MSDPTASAEERAASAAHSVPDHEAFINSPPFFTREGVRVGLGVGAFAGLLAIGLVLAGYWLGHANVLDPAVLHLDQAAKRFEAEADAVAAIGRQLEAQDQALAAAIEELGVQQAEMAAASREATRAARAADSQPAPSYEGSDTDLADYVERLLRERAAGR